MAKELSFPFNAVEDELGQPDRQYDATDFATYFSQFISNGVYPNPSSGLQVQSLYNNMVLTVSDGSGYINGYGYVLDSEDEILMVRVNDSHVSYNRKDGIVLQLDLTARKINVIYKVGTASANPLPPALVRNADIYELQLAEIFVKAGTIKITQADITDTRLDNIVCGIVHGTVDQIDTTTLFNQYKSWYEQATGKAIKDITAFEVQFKADTEAWLDSLKDILDENAAANLLNLINELQSTTYTKTETDTLISTATGINATATHSGTVLAITAPADAVQIIFIAPSNFSESDTYTLNGTAITITDLNLEPLSDAWKQGATVPLTIKGNRGFFKAGGGVYGTLSPQVRNFTAKAGNHQITLTWQNPSDSNFAGLYLVRKQGSAPQKLSDGVKIDAGKATSYTDNEPLNDKLYYYRSFTYNSKKQVQTELTGAVVSATPKAGIPLKDLPVGTLLRVTIAGQIKNHMIVNQGKPSDLYSDSCDGTWVYPKDITDVRSFGSTNSYVDSTIHTHLNSQYLGWLTSGANQLGDIIKQVKIPVLSSTGGSEILNGENGLSTKVFLLSVDELGRYGFSEGSFVKVGDTLEYFKPQIVSNRISQWENVNFKYFSRTPLNNNTEQVGAVNESGNIIIIPTSASGIKGCFVLDKNYTLVFPVPNSDGSYNIVF